MTDKINLLFVTFFGVGKIKFAPGTFASLIITLFFYFLITKTDVLKMLAIKDDILLFYIIFLIYSYYAITKTKIYFKSKDPKEIVIDEVCGQAIPLIALIILTNTPESMSDHGIRIWAAERLTINIENYIIISFLLFRFFDILKPFPIKYFDQKYKNSFGILFDDLLAGIFTTVLISIPLIISLS